MGEYQQEQFLFEQVKNKPRKKEHDVQAMFVSWCMMKRIRFAAYPGGIFLKDRKSAYSIIAKQKKEGFAKGFPDLMLFPKKGKVIYLEFKRDAKGKTSIEQDEWLEFLKDYGHCIVAYGLEDAILKVENILGG